MNLEKYNTTEKLLKHVFVRFDIDDSGFIDEEEFRAAVLFLGGDLSDRETRKMFTELDGNGSGTIDIDEFTSFVKQKEQESIKEAEDRRLMFEIHKLSKDGLTKRQITQKMNIPTPTVALLLEKANCIERKLRQLEEEEAEQSVYYEEVLVRWIDVTTKLHLEHLNHEDLIGTVCKLSIDGSFVKGTIIDTPANEH
eukprot:UN24529